MTMSAHSPHTRDQLLDALSRQETERAAYWSAFDTEVHS